MSEWVIQKNVPYEGICEFPCSNAQEVIDFLSHCSGLDMDDITIIPQPTGSYYPYEFIEAFQKGKVV